MGSQSVSTHTVKNDATTTIVARTTTIVTEHEEVVSEDADDYGGLEVVRKSFRDFWFPPRSGSSSDSEDEDESDSTGYGGLDGVMRRAHDYWKTLTQDAEASAKELVEKAKLARDEAAKDAQWAFFGFKNEARDRYEEAERKYREALAAAERVQTEAQEKARFKWFQVMDKTQQEVTERKDDLSETMHRKWDSFKAAVDSLAYNPPKYACSPTSQYWFSRQNPSADSGWDCREIWDHSRTGNRHHHRHLKALPKKDIPLERFHVILSDLWQQAAQKAKIAPSQTSFESTMKSVKEYYNGLLERAARRDHEAIEELKSMPDKIKSKLNEAKYFEEQTDAWLTTQWNAIVDGAGETKDSYERAFKKAVEGIKKSRTEAYNTLMTNLQKSVDSSKQTLQDTLRHAKDDVAADRARIQKAIHEASQSFTSTLKEAEAKIKTAPKHAYETAVDNFNRDTAQLRAKLEQLAEVARKSGSSLSRKASKTVSSAIHQASDYDKSLRDDASRQLDSAKSRYQAATDSARLGYEQATASMSSMWGAATPFSSLDRVHESYRQWLGDARASLFNEHQQRGSFGLGNGFSNGFGGNHEVTTVYGALAALYVLVLARQIWLHRGGMASSMAGGCWWAQRWPEWVSSWGGRYHLGTTTSGKSGRRQSQSSDGTETHHYNLRNHSHDDDDEHEGEVQAESSKRQDKHGKRRHRDEDEHAAEHQHSHRHNRHHRRRHGESDNSFGFILTKFTSLVPLTLAMHVAFELAGFTRVGLHALFAGLVTSQLLEFGCLSSVMEQLGIASNAREAFGCGREVGHTLGWIVFGLATTANVIQVLHED
ncbi:hypothetical protein BGW38_009506 [Lunasporangiospora selenospora]|uniref:Uncharacterized protein n=1 Tax=Lunasporangiospora selenospora TaxID=979761 RepID=A0A9P6KFW5_9FUNG|nr:hypothetical protein BGW38_009506 [Lunasporangiospora selenospora]